MRCEIWTITLSTNEKFKNSRNETQTNEIDITEIDEQKGGMKNATEGIR